MDNREELKIKNPGRIDKQLSEQLEISRSNIQRLIESGMVSVNDSTVSKKSQSVDSGDRVTINLEEFRRPDAPPEPESGPLTILYEDEYILAVEKPSGMVVHPNDHTRNGTLVNRILFHYPDQETHERAGLVHRLDKGTSGVLLVGRSEEIIDNLKEQFRERSVRKTYRAILGGIPTDTSMKIDVPIGRDPDNPVMMAARPEGKRAVTNILTKGNDGTLAAAVCHPVTGRTHQIRVHCRYVNTPIAGDRKYGGPEANRLMLHAETIEFKHPKTDKRLKVSSELPEEVADLWNDVTTD